MISIVDDDDFVRESLRDLIESLGYEVATFESGESFLVLRASVRPRA
jgi:FixJ family two-component response regulator